MIRFIKKFKKRLIRKYCKLQVLRHLKTEIYPCVICGNTTDFLTIASEDKYKLPIKTQKCKHCGLVFVQPMPTDEFLNHFYSTGLYRGLYKGYLKASKEYIKIDRSIEKANMRIDFIKSNIKLTSTSNILDIGCSEGTFLKEFRGINPELNIYGIEPGNSFSKFNKENMDGLYEDIKHIPSDIKFDLITMWHVLEHLKDPIDTLSQICNKLKENGLIVIEVPDFDAYKNVISNFHIGHLYHFNKDTIGKIIKIAGFTPIEISNTDIGSIRVIAKKLSLNSTTLSPHSYAD